MTIAISAIILIASVLGIIYTNRAKKKTENSQERKKLTIIAIVCLLTFLASAFYLFLNLIFLQAL